MGEWINAINSTNLEKRTDSGIFTECLSGSDIKDGIDMEAIERKVNEQFKGKSNLIYSIAKVKAPPRQSASIQVKFTSRGLLPTQTARESEDEKWRIKIKQMQEMHEQKKRLEDAKKDELNRKFYQKLTFSRVIKRKRKIFFQGAELGSCYECIYVCNRVRLQECWIFVIAFSHISKDEQTCRGNVRLHECSFHSRSRRRHY